MEMFDRKLLSTLLVFGGILLFLYMVKPLIPGFCLALVLVYILNPATNFLQKYTKKRFLATLISFMIVVISFCGLFYLLIGEAVEETVRLLQYPQVKEIIERVIPVDVENLSLNSLVNYPLADTGVRLIFDVGVKAGIFVIQVFVGLLLSFFVVWKNVCITVKDENLHEFLGIIHRGVKQLVRSFFLTAFATGIISIPIYYGFDVPYPFLMVVLTAFLALLPILGAYLLYFPIAVGLYFNRGLVVSVVFFGLCAFFIGVFPDILVRPLTARTKEVGAVPLLVGFLSGLLVFGVSGIVLGPLMVITATAFWRVYIKEN
jgi:predicted PurR-regulated permease PerM